MSDLLTRAKEIKNATEIGENTAERVGGVMVDMVMSIMSAEESLTAQDEALTTHTNQIAALRTKVQDVITVNNEQQTAINSQGTRLTEVEHRSDEYDTQIGLLQNEVTALQQTIRDLTARIEALEKGGGGGGSSADVEDGTLSASASVVNEVMSVQGSVKDGILKL